MPLNKLALIRYKTIDACLCNRQRRWTLEDLIAKVSDAVYEYEGLDSGVSRRTIQADIQLMRSDKLGYEAPIVVYERKYYTYADPEYSITKAPINRADMDTLREVLDLLKQFSGFRYFDSLQEIVLKLEHELPLVGQQKSTLVQFEENPLLKGLQWIAPLYQAIAHKQPILLEYQSFSAQQSASYEYSPYLLKEYRNRWFLLGRRKGQRGVDTRALDRIIHLSILPESVYEPYEGVAFATYFADTIGVTKAQNERARTVDLWFDAAQAPYVLTKPLHASQTLQKQYDNGSIIVRIEVILNLELEREILGFADGVRVLAPERLRERIAKRLESATQHYRGDIA
ncbi:helix-turn-helix transcriptional regulator [Eisenibacter elegans]|jgi:predicted DNA-binding transcriptional regulator YafY|uniref:helix-turn-helix transcriptional regulator n=1 Tax=Eisenibacter elegans TaxID=997 RepID=UPI0004256585|nr:WYL domain-containing protein [Eisenibacter elegans]